LKNPVVVVVDQAICSGCWWMISITTAIITRLIPHRPDSVAVVGPVVAEEVEVPLPVGKESCNDSDSYSFFRMFNHC
jgi:hypothetical protein